MGTKPHLVMVGIQITVSIIDALKTNESAKTQQAAVADPANYKDMPKAMAAFVEAWPLSSTVTDYLRASGVHQTCPREFVLNYWQPQANRSFALRSQFMMNCGTYLHWMVQNVILGPMGVLKGTWIGPPLPGSNSPQVHVGYHPDPEKTIEEWNRQVAPSWIYQENEVWDEEYRIKGHTDGEVSIDRIHWLGQNLPLLKANPHKAFQELQSIGTGTEALFELKTTGDFVFNKTKTAADIADYYKMQADIYLKLTGHTNTVFWYMGRDKMDSNILMYEHNTMWWTQAARKARIIWEAIRDETLPDSMMACSVPISARAKSCVFRGPCWDRRLDFPKYVADGKAAAAAEGRTLLDLSARVWS